MNTKFIGVKEFRQNIAAYAKKARSAKTRYIVVNRNVPLFELTPFDESESLDSIFNEVMKAKADVAAGKFYTQEQILADLG